MMSRRAITISRLIGFGLIAAGVFAGLSGLISDFWSIVLVTAGFGQMVIFGSFG
jgi:hypothetical protein